MRSRTHHLLVPTLALTIGLSAQILPAQLNAQEATEYGPFTGTLVIAGGGNLNGTGIFERFIELGGGAQDGRFVIVPTAGGNYDGDGNVRVYEEDLVLRTWRSRGLRNVSMLHTHDPKIADRDEFVAELKQATAVWFIGGRQWNIVDSYAETRTYDEFHKVLERGGVIGGSSAGATIQGEYLVRGDTRGSKIVMTDEPNHQLGFEFLRKVGIDQHINTRNRWDHLIPVIDQKTGAARHRSLGGHGDHRYRRHLRGHRQVDGRGARQHARPPTVGEVVFRACTGRRLRHEGPPDPGAGRMSGPQRVRHRLPLVGVSAVFSMAIAFGLP